MKSPLALAFLVACFMVTSLTAQEPSWRTSDPSRGPSTQSRVPRLQSQAPSNHASQQQGTRVPGMHGPVRAAAPQSAASQPLASQTARAPFQLSPEEQARVDSVLIEWERRTEDIKTFECNFAKLKYDLVFGAKDKPSSVDDGTIKYSKPNQGLYEITGSRPEKWCTDGASFYQYDFKEKHVIEHVLGPEAKGTGFIHCPVPFVFGAKADDIKKRYWIRLFTPADAQGQIWIETYPKTQVDAANYRRVDVILNAKTMLPQAIQVYNTGGQSRDVYSFGKPLINDPLRVFRRGAFSGPAPFGWKRVREQQTAGRPTGTNGRR